MTELLLVLNLIAGVVFGFLTGWFVVDKQYFATAFCALTSVINLTAFYLAVL